MEKLKMGKLKMGKFRRFFGMAAVAFFTVFAVSCEKTGKTGSADGVILEADKTGIIADGEDAVNFKVYFEGQDVTSSSSVCLDSGMCLMPGGDSHVFTTDTPGEYVFTATYQGEHSEPVTVTAR